MLCKKWRQLLTQVAVVFWPFHIIDITRGTFYEDGKSVLSLVDVDLAAYRRMLDNKTVRRNVTLPNWLNQEAEKSHINVSKVLQEALMAKLGVSR